MCVCAYGKEAVWNGRIVNQVVYFVSEGLEGIRPGEGGALISLESSYQSSMPADSPSSAPRIYMTLLHRIKISPSFPAKSPSMNSSASPSFQRKREERRAFNSVSIKNLKKGSPRTVI